MKSTKLPTIEKEKCKKKGREMPCREMQQYKKWILYLNKRKVCGEFYEKESRIMAFLIDFVTWFVVISVCWRECEKRNCTKMERSLHKNTNDLKSVKESA